MNVSRRVLSAWDDLRTRHAHQTAAIRSRLEDFSSVPSSEYFYELAYCLLTPQSSAVHADAAIGILRSLRFLEHPFDASDILRTPSSYIRFHHTKAKRLLEARDRLQDLLKMLETDMPAIERRLWLVRNVKGLGMKEATHFLRNIGKNGGLAILDRHILRNLRRFRAIRSVPPVLTTKRYLFIEKRFQTFAVEIGIPIDELDLLFWSMETGEIRK